MKKIFSFAGLLLVAVMLLTTLTAYTQNTDVPPASFDVMVTNYGDIIHCKVLEVGLKIIKYKRTDIPDGPVYEVPRNEIYAISYRNQLKEYLTPVDSSIFAYPLNNTILKKKDTEKKIDSTFRANIANGTIRLGFGYYRNISKVSEIDQYEAEFGLPGFFFTYSFPFKNNLDLGLALGWARFKYTSDEFSEYDMLLIEKKINESLLSISALAKYSFNAEPFTPYVLGGISYINSIVKSDSKISFTEDQRIVAVQGGGRSGSPGFLLRAGTDLKISTNFSCYADFGTGLTLFQVGVVFKLKK